VGLRTHLIVVMAAATFTVLSTHFIYWQHYGKDDLVAVAPSRIAASVVSAVGFLAGGAILRTRISVQGLTTAAGLWLARRSGCAPARECTP
jgi:putative Mg2+ transporter-C (MgtC) family protein